MKRVSEKWNILNSCELCSSLCILKIQSTFLANSGKMNEAL